MQVGREIAIRASYILHIIVYLGLISNDLLLEIKLTVNRITKVFCLDLAQIGVFCINLSPLLTEDISFLYVIGISNFNSL